MCLFIFSNLGDCLKGCGKSLAACCRSLNPIALLLSLVTCPVSFFIVLLWGLGAAIFKLPSATYYQECLMWSHYCSVLKTGKKAYNGQSKKNCMEDCCDSCLAELYCCGMPVMLAIAVFYPFLLLLMLIATGVSYAFRGLCAGAIGKDLKCDGWWPRVRDVIMQCDLETSRVGYETDRRGLLCANGELCNDGDNGQQGLPGPHAPPPHAQQYGAPQPQVMMQGRPSAVPVAQPVFAPQQAYVPQPQHPPHAYAQPAQAYVPTAQPAIPISQGYPTAQPAYGGRAQPAQAPPPPPPPQQSTATTAGGFTAWSKRALASAVAALAASHRSRTPAPLGPEGRAPVAWMPKRGCPMACALVPAHRRRCRCLWPSRLLGSNGQGRTQRSLGRGEGGPAAEGGQGAAECRRQVSRRAGLTVPVFCSCLLAARHGVREFRGLTPGTWRAPAHARHTRGATQPWRCGLNAFNTLPAQSLESRWRGASLQNRTQKHGKRDGWNTARCPRGRPDR